VGGVWEKGFKWQLHVFGVANLLITLTLSNLSSTPITIAAGYGNVCACVCVEGAGEQGWL